MVGDSIEDLQGLLFLFPFMVGSDAIANVLVDISHWQETVDFKLSKLDGIEAIIHKATEGQAYVDNRYAERRPLAEKEGMLWGAYHYGIGGVSGKLQAEHFLKTVGDYEKVLLVLDHETNTRGQTMNVYEAEEFVKRVKELTGRLPVIYGSPAFLSAYSTVTLNQCPLWVANWTGANSPILPKGKDSWVFWQYTDGQKGGTPRYVKGIGHCDRDRFNGSLEELRTKWPNFENRE